MMHKVFMLSVVQTSKTFLNFEKDYPDLHVFKLEQNYRSTQNIVNVANSIIANNKDQLKKTVYSEKEHGDKIKVMRAFSDNEEGKMVAEAIHQEHANKGCAGMILLFCIVLMPNQDRWKSITQAKHSLQNLWWFVFLSTQRD